MSSLRLVCRGTWGGQPGVLSAARVQEICDRFTAGRGSAVSPASGPLCYGGETSCLELVVGNHGRCVLDAGTGFRMVTWSEDDEVVHLFLSHLHVDHVLGLMLNGSLWTGALRVVVHAPKHPRGSLPRLLDALFQPPFWPVSLRMLGERLRCVEHDPLKAEVAVVFGDGSLLHARAERVAHTDLAVAWRLDHEGRSVVYAPDREAARCDGKRFARFAAGAAVLVHDAQYLPEEYPRYEGWGHSTYEDAVRAALDAGVDQLLLWHHAHDRGYDALEHLGERARLYMEAEAARRGQPPVPTRIAYDGLVLTVP